MWQRKKPWQINAYVCKSTKEAHDNNYLHCGCLDCRERREREEMNN